METQADHGARYTGALDLDKPHRSHPNSKAKRWSLEYLCNGRPWNWTGPAVGPAHAEVTSRQELAEVNPDFRPADARLVKCVEVAS